MFGLPKLQIDGTFSVVGEQATAHIRHIEGEANFFRLAEGLKDMGRAAGAKTFRVKTTFANEELMEVIRRKYSKPPYSFRSEGGFEFIEGPL